MKKILVYAATLLVITFGLNSCQNDDDNTMTPPPPTGETVDVEAIVERLTGGNSKT